MPLSCGLLTSCQPNLGDGTSKAIGYWWYSTSSFCNSIENTGEINMLHKRYKQKRNRNPIINILFYIVSYWTNLEILFSEVFPFIIKKLINKQKMSWNILYLTTQNPTFPYPRTYGSALRNVRFPYAKHRTYKFILQSTQWDFPVYPYTLSQYLNSVSSSKFSPKRQIFIVFR